MRNERPGNTLESTALVHEAFGSTRRARVVELRFFGGMSVDETALVLAVSPQTVMRDWKVAKVWLTRELKKQGVRAKRVSGV